ncbi:MAG: GHKL domain-containing protein [Oscillospiraceae bacterium]|nr:GHKL domain-containing protein [Oscillospiraceae bacterium]
MDEIEQQQTATRKFKHDYQNILLSLEGFFESNDFPGAKDYYYSQIKATSEIITKDNFTLDRLIQIKIPEIKGLLIAKLMMAQSNGINTSVEVEDIIDNISIDSVAIVRMLGIILDNAIEELRELDSGKLAITCYKINTGVIFVVENTCRSDIQALHELEQYGFSTKGNGRGLGLNNLSELVAANASNVALQTSIVDGCFIQKIVVGGVI